MLRRHPGGTSIILVVVLAGAMAVGAAWYLADRPEEYRADAAVAVVPVDRLDDADAVDAYTALGGGGVAETLAAAVERQADLEDGDLSVATVEGSSVVVATGTAESVTVAERIADDAIAALDETGLVRGPFEVEEITAAAGTATAVDAPWGVWSIVAGAAVVLLVVVQQLVWRGLRRRSRHAELASPVDAPVAPAPEPASPVAASNGAANNGNGAHRLDELSPIAWSAPPPD